MLAFVPPKPKELERATSTVFVASRLDTAHLALEACRLSEGNPILALDLDEDEARQYERMAADEGKDVGLVAREARV